MSTDDAGTWVPAVADVGALLRARTKDSNGNELGTFTANTRPTGDEVALLIQQAADDILAATGADIPALVAGVARSMAVYRAAMLVELSYWPEQVASNKSPYAAYKALYDQGLPTLVKAVMSAEAGEDVGGEDVARFPSYSFPQDTGGMVGWGTRW